MLTVLMISGERCGLCKRMIPTFEKVGREYADDSTVQFLEKDFQAVIPFLQEHQIEVTTLPSFVCILDNQVVAVLRGVQDYDKFCSTIDELLGG